MNWSEHTLNPQGRYSALRIFIAFIVTFLTLPTLADNTAINTDTLCLMEWNVENLFDCRHDTLKNDEEFLPTSLRHWTYYRYRHKLDQVAKVITAVGGWTPPALVALCEVENDSVLIALTRFSALSEQKYRYVMTNSPDQRGIDVALLYQRDRFRLLKYRSIPVKATGFRPTRDILHVTGLIATNDTLDLFIIHAPSRAGGTLESEPYRLICAKTLKESVEEVTRQRTKPHLLITGDFNDFPNSPAIAKVLQALPPTDSIDEHKLYHMLAGRVLKTKEGTYKYKGEWNLLDHLIVSGSMLNQQANVYTSESLADIIHFPFLLTDDQTHGGVRPLRTYYGMKYEDGFSDHLPIRLKIVIKE
jgi:endonuclease/exonuclease/phosphatase family metal-dependent hydrolase